MEVNEFRVSSIWVDAVPAVLAEETGRFGNLVDRSSYAALLKKLIDDPDADDLVTVPWPRRPDKKFPETNFFWNSYLFADVRSRPTTNPGERAWDAAVPLRRKNALVRIRRDERTFVECWYHPHGVATAVTARFGGVSGSFDAAAMQAAADAFLRGPLDVTWAGATTERHTTVDALAREILDKLRAEAFGAVSGGSPEKPIRVVTITRATAENDDDASADAPFVAAARWITGDAGSEPVTPDQDVRVFAHGLVVYNRAHATNPRATHTLGCLHRNAAIASMQVASLVSAAALLTAAGDGANGVLPGRIDRYARRVAGLIGRINGTDKTWADNNRNTYDRRFLRRRIADGNANGVIDVLRTRLQMGPLT